MNLLKKWATSFHPLVNYHFPHEKKKNNLGIHCVYHRIPNFHANHQKPICLGLPIDHPGFIFCKDKMSAIYLGPWTIPFVFWCPSNFRVSNGGYNYNNSECVQKLTYNWGGLPMITGISFIIYGFMFPCLVGWTPSFAIVSHSITVCPKPVWGWNIPYQGLAGYVPYWEPAQCLNPYW